jgi:hypothetical protein
MINQSQQVKVNLTFIEMTLGISSEVETPNGSEIPKKQEI